MEPLSNPNKKSLQDIADRLFSKSSQNIQATPESNSSVSNGQTVTDSTIASNEAPHNPNTPSTAQNSSLSNNNEPVIPKAQQTKEIFIEPLRTYEKDIRNAITNQNVSVVKMALAQSAKNQKEDEIFEQNSPTSQKNIMLIAMSALFLVIGIGVVIVAFNYIYHPNEMSTPETPSLKAPDMISFDSVGDISLQGTTKAEFISKLAKAQTIKTEGLIHVFTIHHTDATSTLSTQELFSIFDSRIPPALLRSFEPMFTFGLYEKTPFIILKTNSYDTAFAGMLEWEPFMNDDFRDVLFSSKLESALPVTTTTVSSTSIDATISTSSQVQATTSLQAKTNQAYNNFGLASVFTDEIIKNKNARILKNKKGDNVLIYEFADKEHIIISQNINAIAEVFERLKLKKLVR